MLWTQEHYDLMAQFEKQFAVSIPGCYVSSLRFQKEDKSLWTKSRIYQDGATNNLFIAYRMGYAAGKLAERLGT